MSVFAVLAIALALSADAFAVALARGASGRVRGTWAALRMGMLFGTSEGLMVLAGWFLASRFAASIEAYDHWVALLLLGAVGGHTVWEGVKGDSAATEEPAPPRRGRWLGNLATVIGTSIDSAAVGAALALLAVDIWLAAGVIGLTSFTMSTIGMMFGARLGLRFGRLAEIGGGLALIGIGLYIFLSHMNGG